LKRQILTVAGMAFENHTRDKRICTLLQLLKEIPAIGHASQEETITSWLEEAVDSWQPSTTADMPRPSSQVLLEGLYTLLYRCLLDEASAAVP